jgi:acetyltransferase-like isoleucine patch superfamily enzyme
MIGRSIRKFGRWLIDTVVGHPVEIAKRNGLQVGIGCDIPRQTIFGTEPYLVSIGDYVDLSINVVFVTHDGSTRVFRHLDKYKGVKRFGRITVHNRVFIGWGAIIMPGVTIGENSIVCAHSLVVQDVPPNTVVWGNPARPLMSTEAYADKAMAKSNIVDEEAYLRDKKAELLRVLPRPW